MCDLRKTHKVIPNSQCGFVTRTNTQFLDRKEFKHCIDRRCSTFIGAIPGFLIHLSDSQQTFISCSYYIEVVVHQLSWQHPTRTGPKL